MIEHYKNYDIENIFYIDENGVNKQEKWLNIRHYLHSYMISDLGRVKSLSRKIKGKNKGYKMSEEIILKQKIDRNGYLVISLARKASKKNTHTVHRLVAIEFISNRKNKPEVNHIGKYPNGKEGNKLDNRAISLKWATKKENAKHARDNGLRDNTFGEKSSASKLTEFQVVLIKRIHRRYGKFNMAKLSRKLKVSETTVSYVIKDKIWRHVVI